MMQDDGTRNSKPNGCKKIWFSSYEDAVEFAEWARTMSGKKVFPKKTTDAYICPICNVWHITTHKREIG